MPVKSRKVFISYSGHDSFEANLLQYALETMLAPEGVVAWTYQRDQPRSEKEIAKSIKKQVRNSAATIFLVSPSTIKGSAAQWMELAYADAYNVQTYVLLHHLDYNEMKAKYKGVPPLLLAIHCTPALEWRTIADDLQTLFKKENCL
jgi:hypothetical protein